MSPSGASKLRAYLDEHKVSVPALAGQLGVRRMAVYRWLSGDRVPLVQFAVQLERVTGGAVPVESWCDRQTRTAA